MSKLIGSRHHAILAEYGNPPMCGRFTLRTPNQILLEVFDLPEAPDFPLRYNIAPTQDVATLRWNSDAQRELAFMHWGLVPFWAKEPTIGSRMINARCETVAEKPAFRHAFRRRRCLIPTDGYYEWKKLENKKKQPYYIRRRDNGLFAFAGLWEIWKQTDPPLESVTIITTSANSTTRTIHDRMPVILRPEDYDRWLRTDSDAEQLQELLVPLANDDLCAVPVSTLVNSPRNESPQCIEEIDYDPPAE
jgi:putative SOS response-associated peptidase YedK